MTEDTRRFVERTRTLHTALVNRSVAGMEFQARLQPTQESKVAFQASSIKPPYDAGSVSDGIYTSAIARMYFWITLGLVVTAATAWFAYQLDVLEDVGLLGYLVIVAVAIGLLFILHFSVQRLPSPITASLYLVFTAVEGVTVSYIFGAYTNETIVLAFGLTAGLFAAMSVIGFTTKRDLSKWGPILLFGLLGIVIVSLINIFVGSGLLSWVVTIVALPLFLGLVIWETKEVKEEAQEAAAIGDAKAAWSIGIIGAVGLYLSFLNIFLILLRLLDWFNGD